MGNYPGLLGWAQSNQMSPTYDHKKIWYLMKEKVSERWYIAIFEEERGSPWAKKCRHFLKSGEEKKTDSVIEVPEKQLGPDNTLMLAQSDSRGNFRLQSCVALGLVTQSCWTLCDPVDCSPPGSSVHGDSPGENTGVGCRALLQGVFPTQGSNPRLPHCMWTLSCLSHRGSPAYRAVRW